MATNTTLSQVAANPNYLNLYYEKKLLSVLEPRLVLQPLGKKQRLPKGFGKQVKWLRYNTIEPYKVSGAITALTEGGSAPEVSFTTSSVTADIQQYGQYSKVSDLLSDVAIDPVLENLSERFGIAASKTIEELIVNEIAANCTDQFVNDKLGPNDIVDSDILNHKELIEAMIVQKAAFVGPHESGDYVCVLHPRSEYDLLIDDQAGSFLDIMRYTNNKPLLNGEIGRMYGMRFLVSDKMPTAANATAINVHKSFVIGEEAFGVVELNSDSLKMITKRHGSAGASDPLDQFATVGYKIHGFAVKYLAESPPGGVKKPRIIAISAASNI